MVSIPHRGSELDLAGSRVVLGLDIGGTKLAAGVVDERGTLRSFLRVPTDRLSGGWELSVRTLLELGDAALEAAGVRTTALLSVGIGSGGPLDPASGMILRPPNLPDWDEVPIARLVAEHFDRPAHLENDANAAVLASARWGSWAGIADIVYITVSTGIGGGVLVDGRLLRGTAGNVGELGHTVIAWRGRPCTCGQLGCVEAYVSGSSIARRAAEGVAAGRRTPLAQLPFVTAADVSTAAAAGDVFAREIWDDTTSILGVLVTSILNLFEPRVVILGGGVTEAGSALIDPVRRYALAHAMSPAGREADVVISEHGAAIGVLGSAAVALERAALESLVSAG